jgi:hypothetical protein
MDSDAAWLEYSVALIDRLLRVALDMLQHLIGKDEIISGILKVQRQDGVVRLVCFVDFRRVYSQMIAQVRRKAYRKDTTRVTGQVGADTP